VVEARDGREACERLAAGGFDLVVLDILMPEADGLEVCRRVRRTSDVPIIFLSSKDEELDRVLGLELGADDYLSKPFSPRELLARVRAVLRRRHEPPSALRPPEVLRRGPLEMDLGRHRCTWAGREVVLTVTEFALLRALLGAPGKVFSRDDLVDHAWGPGHAITDRTIDSHVRRIRQKLAAVGADPIETVYGVGYRLREDLAA
jgi:two-component system OmpR family response regulator